MTEEEILQHALDLTQQEKPEPEPRGSIEEETIFLKTLARRVPVSKVKAIISEANKHFGGIGLMRLTPEQRTAKAKMAAAARWKKEKKKKRGKPEGGD